MHIISASSQEQGTSSSAISRSSIRCARRSTRKAAAAEIKEHFSPGVALTVHWDGKLLPDATRSTKVDRLPVLVTGESVSKLLAVPKLPSGTGEAMSSAVVASLVEWSLTDNVQSMSLDTTASNTGVRVGACLLIERKFRKPLLHLACRHHVHEVIIEKVFTECLGSSSGPGIDIFKKFRDKWSSID